MKKFYVTILCLLFVVDNSESSIPNIFSLADKYLFCNFPPDIILEIASSLLFDCSFLGKDTFINTTSTVSSGSLALRFYNGSNADTSFEIPLPLRKGTVITELQGFDKSKKTLFYFFGYKENINAESVHTIVNAYFARKGYNIFVVDWSGIACRDYISAYLGSNTGAPKKVASAIEQMIEGGYSKDLIELVAHSLGTQVAAILGRDHFKGSLPIIVGLDPAGPGFTCLNGLHKGDASFVHLIHTDRLFYGNVFLCGDFDVITNKNGFRLQSDCPCIFPPFAFTFKEACSHHLSWKIYAQSVSAHDGSAEFLCTKCDCYKDFKENTCDGNPLVALYGADSNSSRGNCYMKTSGNEPFALGAHGARYAEN